MAFYHPKVISCTEKPPSSANLGKNFKKKIQKMTRADTFLPFCKFPACQGTSNLLNF